MSTITTIINRTIDLDQGVGQPQPLSQRLVYGNDQAHTFRLRCTRQGKDVPLVNTRCMGFVKRKDGVTIPLEGTVEGCTASITLTAPCYAAGGSVTISMELITDTARATHGLWLAQVECATTEEIGGEAAISISNALERLDAAARPNWQQNDSSMPDYIQGRTHYMSYTTLDCTGNLGVYKEWRKVSDMQFDQYMLDMDETSAVIESDGQQSTTALSWTLLNQESSMCSIGRINLFQSIILIVHDEGYGLGIGVYVADSASPAVLSLTWGQAIPLDDCYIPDSIARKALLPPMDATLTEPGSTADAKAVGDRLAALADVIAPVVMDDAIAVHDSAARPLIGLSLYGRTTQNGSPAPDAPIPLVSTGDEGSITVTVRGKNLLDLNKVTNSGCTHTLSDGVLHIASTAAGTWRGVKCADMRFHAGKTYVLSAMVDQIVSGVATMGFRRSSGNVFVKRATATSPGLLTLTFTPTEDTEAYVSLLCTDSTSSNGDVTFSHIQLEISSTPSVYAPFTHSGSLVLSTPDGLRGVPVTSGGNYTDMNGQMWLCDEIDLGRGVYVQRIAAVSSADLTNWTASSLMNANGQVYFHLLNNAQPGGAIWTTRSAAVLPAQISQEQFVLQQDSSDTAVIYVVSAASTAAALTEELVAEASTLLYPLAQPAETQLSASTCRAFAELCTLQPDTTVLSNSSAGMSLRYAADTQAYIDQRIAAIVAAMLHE